MKKFATLAVLVTVLVVGGACASDSKKDDSPNVFVERPTTTTTVDNSYAVSQCLSTGSDLADLTAEYAELTGDNLYLVATDYSVRAAALQTGAELSSTLRLWASTCREYVGSEAADQAIVTADAVDEVLDAIRAL